MKKIILFIIMALVVLSGLFSLYADDTDAYIAKLRRDLDSSSEAIRIKAVKELSKILDRKVADPLIYALRDESRFVRKQACIGLGELKHPRAVKPLGRLLLKEDDDFVRKECALALGDMGFADALPYLEKQLEDEESLIVKFAIKKAIKKLYEN